MCADKNIGVFLCWRYGCDGKASYDWCTVVAKDTNQIETGEQKWGQAQRINSPVFARRPF